MELIPDRYDALTLGDSFLRYMQISTCRGKASSAWSSYLADNYMVGHSFLSIPRVGDSFLSIKLIFSR